MTLGERARKIVDDLKYHDAVHQEFILTEALRSADPELQRMRIPSPPQNVLIKENEDSPRRKEV